MSDVTLNINAKDNASPVLSKFNGVLSNIFSTAMGFITRDVFRFLGQQATAFAKSIYTEGAQAEQAMADLNATLLSTGGVSGMTVESVSALASSLQQVTMFADDTILTGQNMLLTFTNIGKDVFPMATEAMLNMSQKMKQDVSQTAIQLGKALNDPINGLTALRRVGVTFTQDQENVIKSLVATGDVAGAQAVILAELEKEFGGVARAAGQTLPGKIEIMKNSLGSLKETIYFSLLPALAPVIDRITAFANSPLAAAMAENVGKGFTQLAQDAFALGDQLRQAFETNDWGDIFSSMGDGFVGLTDAFRSAVDNVDWGQFSQAIIDGIDSIDWATLGESVNEGFGNIFEGLSTVVMEVDWSGLFSSAGEAFLNFMAGLTGQQNWDNVKSVWSANLDQLKTIASDKMVQTGVAMQVLSGVAGTNAVTSMAMALGNGVGAIASAIYGWIPGIANALEPIKKLFFNMFQAAAQQAVRALLGMQEFVANTVKNFIAAIQKVIRPINLAINVSIPNFAALAQQVADGWAMLKAAQSGSGYKGGKSTAPGGGNSPGTTGSGSGSQLAFAGGGIASGPRSGYPVTLHGTEAVIPLEHGDVPIQLKGGGAGGDNINIYLSYAPTVSFADASELREQMMPLIIEGVRLAKARL
jgi:hypothetical protein